jgi:hypothetical protein
MIQSPEDLAAMLSRAIRPDTAGEAEPTIPKRVAFVSPPRAVFFVRTVEGREFRVVVDEMAEGTITQEVT